MRQLTTPVMSESFDPRQAAPSVISFLMEKLTMSDGVEPLAPTVETVVGWLEAVLDDADRLEFLSLLVRARSHFDLVMR